MTETQENCVICRRFREGRAQEGSVGGAVLDDEHWYAYHAPFDNASLGQLALVAKRHFLDFADMTPSEAATFGKTMRALYLGIRQTVRPARIYTSITLEGIPHFHVWIVPRLAGEDVKGWDLLKSSRQCSPSDAIAVCDQLRTFIAADSL